MVLHSDAFTSDEICRINYCRLYLHAVKVSDLCLADGVTMDPTMLAGSPGLESSVSTWVHVTQARPNESSWRLWRRACAMWSQHGKLYHPLGAWKPSTRLRCKWPFYHDHSDGFIYVHQISGFLRCVSIDPIRFAPVSSMEWEPTITSIPIHARLTIQGEAWIPIIPPRLNRIPHPVVSATFPEFLETLDEWETELFAHLTMDVDCYTLAGLVNAQHSAEDTIQLLTMSDGSDEAGAMTFG